MLLITNDGRKLALDQRLMNELLPDEEGSKVNACVREVFRYWEQGKEEKLTQLLFCDLSVPKSDGTFSVYNDIRDKLIAKGIPPQEIEFIHDANTEARKKELFSKVRRGAVRILMGSTFKMGAGTNVQNLIIASHDLDCPWRPWGWQSLCHLEPSMLFDCSVSDASFSSRVSCHLTRATSCLLIRISALSSTVPQAS